MSCKRQPRIRRPQRALAAWWLRWFTAVAFAVHIHYLHCHLLSETHLSHAASVHAHDQHAGEADGDHHNSDHHSPHASTDHQLQMVSKHDTPLVAVCFSSSETPLSLVRTESLGVRPRDARLKPPGESPPDPLQPRAPPLA